MQLSVRSGRLAPAFVLGGLLALACMGASADGAVVIGYQTGVDPAKAAQAYVMSGTAASCTLSAGRWQRFASGPAVLSALASDAIDIGNLGSVPLAAGLARRMPLVVFLISAQIRGAEALVVRPAITAPRDLLGKTIATPFGSTSHYSLLNALRHWGIRPQQLRLVNLSPGDIAAAWQRGDLDGAFVWSPALSMLQQRGKVLVDAGQVADWGAPTFEVWVARKAFAERHPDVLRAFSALILRAYRDYNRAPAAWSVRHAAAIARLTGAPAAMIPALLSGAHFPAAIEQRSAQLLGGGSAAATQATAAFLWRQGVIGSTGGDDRAAFDPSYLGDAAAMDAADCSALAGD